MKMINIITLILAVAALAIAIYTHINSKSPKLIIDSNRSEYLGMVQNGTVGSEVNISKNWLGTNRVVELRRGNRLDVFDGTQGVFTIAPPRDFFDLSPSDEEAANRLSGSIAAQSSVRPFHPFLVSWEVTGPSDAIERVESYQMNVFSSGPIFNLSSNAPQLIPDGLKIEGNVLTSIWESGEINLWGHFSSGIREFAATDVSLNTSECFEDSLSLVIILSFLRGEAADKFVETIQEKAGDEVTVMVTQPAYTSVSNNGFFFELGLKLVADKGTLFVDMEMEFLMVPKKGDLGARFHPPGSYSVLLSAEMGPWYRNLSEIVEYIASLGTGNQSFYEYQSEFTNGLKRLAEEFSLGIGKQLRGIQDEEDYEENSPGIVEAGIDIESDVLKVMLCPMPSGLPVSTGGQIPSQVIKIN